MLCHSCTRLWFQRQTYVLGFNEKNKTRLRFPTQFCQKSFSSVVTKQHTEAKCMAASALRRDLRTFLPLWLLTFCLKQRQLSFRMPLSMTAGVTNPYITQRCLVYAQCKGQRSYCRPRLLPCPLLPPVYWLVASHWEMLGNQCSATCFGEYKCQRHDWNETRKQAFQFESKRAKSIITECDFRCILSKADSCLEGKHGRSTKDFFIAEVWMPLVCWGYLFFISFDGFACSPRRSQYWCPTGINIRPIALCTMLKQHHRRGGVLALNIIIDVMWL